LISHASANRRPDSELPNRQVRGRDTVAVDLQIDMIVRPGFCVATGQPQTAGHAKVQIKLPPRAVSIRGLRAPDHAGESLAASVSGVTINARLPQSTG
jgi:hypothetical protein